MKLNEELLEMLLPRLQALEPGSQVTVGSITVAVPAKYEELCQLAKWVTESGASSITVHEKRVIEL